MDPDENHQCFSGKLPHRRLLWVPQVCQHYLLRWRWGSCIYGQKRLEVLEVHCPQGHQDLLMWPHQPLEFHSFSINAFIYHEIFCEVWNSICVVIQPVAGFQQSQ